MSLGMLHLSVPIRDIEGSLDFYCKLLGCTATRVETDRVDFDFFGHHLVGQLSEIEASHRSVHIGKDDYPLRHFGVIVRPDAYLQILDRLQKAGVPFAMEPRKIFVGTNREQDVFLVYDPSGNAVEIKALPELHQVFSTI